MMNSLLLILIIAGLAWGWIHLKQQPPAARKKLIWRGASIAFALLLLLLMATGRLHWLIAIIGALLPFLRGLLGMGIQLLPLWLKRRQGQQQHQEPPRGRVHNPPMEFQEAMDILGLNQVTRDQLTPELINDAHRRLIQKLHPDRGGSDYLAAKINQARDYLLRIIQG